MTGVQPDLAWAGLTALSLFVIANVGFELSTVFYNAFLPELAPAERVGRLSGWAWGLGYAGGLLSLVLALAVLAREQPLVRHQYRGGFQLPGGLPAGGRVVRAVQPAAIHVRPASAVRERFGLSPYGGLRRVETYVRAAASLSGHRPAAGRPTIV